jgi:uncharacterized protein YcnI
MSSSFVRTVVAAVAVALPALASAHVSVTPRESMAGATEKYTIRIPTEDKVATTGADIEFPEGVIVETIQVPSGWKYDLKRKDDRIVSMAIQADVKPGEFIEVAFVARNPRDKKEIVWTLRQRFADGKVTDWTTGPRGTYPTAVTKLTPRPTATQ